MNKEGKCIITGHHLIRRFKKGKNIMSFEIVRGSTEFKYAFNDPSQLKQWMLNEKPLLGLCFAGRSNVGKSSLINSLFGKTTARTSKTPGRTRSINVFSFDILHKGTEENKTFGPFFLMDLPGYGYAKVSNEMSKNWDEILGLFFRHCPSTVRVLNIQDARRPLQSADKSFADFIKKFHQLNSILILNKIDKLKTQKEKAQLKKSKKTIIEEQVQFKEVHFVSAEKQTGVKELEQSLINFFLNKNALS